MAATLRGWSTNTADWDGDTILSNCLCRYDFTIPDTYTPGDFINVVFTGGIASDGGPVPSAFAVRLGATIYQYAGGSADEAPLSDSGLTYAIGTQYVAYQSYTTFPDWTDFGPNPDVTAITGGPNQGGTVLIDGTPDWPGEGSFANPVMGRPSNPIGWAPREPPFSTDIPPGTINLEVGETCTLEITTQTEVQDEDNPDFSVYPYLTSITIDLGAGPVEIPLSSLKTGFNAGATTVPWPFGGWPPTAAPAAPWNPVQAIGGSQPPQAAGYQDMWLVIPSAGQTTQGMIF